jgi:Peptidase M15
MTQISRHFSLEEFQKDKGDIPQDRVEAFTVLATSILDLVRDWCAAPLLITSGYRDADANARAHGQPNSEHIATPDWCAADFYCPDKASNSIFDWMRNNPSLPFHQLILERGNDGSSIVHVSWNRLKTGVRSVLTGATHNAEPYLKVDYVAYTPITPASKDMQA